MTLDITGEALDVGIVVRDADVMLTFYREFLGLTIGSVLDLSDSMGFTIHFFPVGASSLKLVVPVDVPEDANPPGGMRDATGIRYVTINVASIDAVLEGLEAAGGMLAEPVIEFGPTKVALVRDPEGNVLELLAAG